jgi:hypothetical protein
MSAGPWRGTGKAHMRRTIEAAQAAGIKIECLEVTKDGTIRIVPKDATQSSTVTLDTGEWKVA